MKTSPQGIAEIAGHEGIVLSPYRDSVGVWTVGVGHTASAGSPNPADLPRGQEQPLAAILEIGSRGSANLPIPAGARIAMARCLTRAASVAELQAMFYATRGRFGV